jgi:ADP-ribosylglycohydrolase
MLGAIIGDIIGSVYEHESYKDTDFPLFSNRATYTDDSVLTVAVAHVLLENADYVDSFKYFGRKYPAGYGSSFAAWMYSDSREPYNSYGNGSAMRVSAVGFAFNSVDEVLLEAERSAAVTHNHPEGIKGAQAVALAIYLARMGASKAEITTEISTRFGYDLSRTLAEIRPSYTFKVSCQESVPESIIAFLEADNFESSVRNAVSLGGDADTMACIAGSIAQAFYKNIPAEIVSQAETLLPQEFLAVIRQFNARFGVSY